MKTLDVLRDRRSFYDISKEVDLKDQEILEMLEEVTELVPDAFNMKSSRLAFLTGKKHDQLWDGIYDVFEGRVPREKIDSFKAGFGTILYFIDRGTVESMQKAFPDYRENFPVWANQASGMLQISVWSGLRELGLGASLQHYNPIIDDFVREFLDLPETYSLVAEMPFGAIVKSPDPKEKEDISKRVRLYR